MGSKRFHIAFRSIRDKYKIDMERFAKRILNAFRTFVEKKKKKEKGRESVKEKCLRSLFERVSKPVASLTSEDVTRSLFKR